MLAADLDAKPKTPPPGLMVQLEGCSSSRSWLCWLRRLRRHMARCSGQPPATVLLPGAVGH